MSQGQARREGRCCRLLPPLTTRLQEQEKEALDEPEPDAHDGRCEEEVERLCAAEDRRQLLGERHARRTTRSDAALRAAATCCCCCCCQHLLLLLLLPPATPLCMCMRRTRNAARDATLCMRSAARTLRMHYMRRSRSNALCAASLRHLCMRRRPNVRPDGWVVHGCVLGVQRCRWPCPVSACA
jgi:hypothetical protein